MTPGSFREMFVTNNRRKSCLLPPAPGHALLPLLAHTQALAELLCAQDHLTSPARSHTQRNLNSSNAASTGPAQTEPPHAADSYQPALTASFAPIYERRSPRTATADRSRPEGPARTRCGELRGPPRRRRQLRATPSTSLSERPRTEAALRIALGRGTGRDEALPNRKDAAAPHSSRPLPAAPAPPAPAAPGPRRAQRPLPSRRPPPREAPGRTDGRTHAAPPAPGTHTTAREIIQETISAAAAAARSHSEPGPNGRAPRSPAPRAPPAARTWRHRACALCRLRPSAEVFPGARPRSGVALRGAGTALCSACRCPPVS